MQSICLTNKSENSLQQNHQQSLRNLLSCKLHKMRATTSVKVVAQVMQVPKREISTPETFHMLHLTVLAR